MPDIRPPQTFGDPATIIFFKTEAESKGSLKPNKVTARDVANTAAIYPGSDAQELIVELEPKGKKGPAANATHCTRDMTKKVVDQCEFRVMLAEAPGEDMEYSVKVLIDNNKQLPVTPEAIKVAVKKAPIKGAKPEASTRP